MRSIEALSFSATGYVSTTPHETCMVWTGMLAALTIWIEHGITLREGVDR